MPSGAATWPHAGVWARGGVGAVWCVVGEEVSVGKGGVRGGRRSVWGEGGARL